MYTDLYIIVAYFSLHNATYFLFRRLLTCDYIIIYVTTYYIIHCLLPQTTGIAGMAVAKNPHKVLLLHHHLLYYVLRNSSILHNSSVTLHNNKIHLYQ